MENTQAACRELIELIIAGDVTSQDELNNAKKSGEHSL